jgi:iron complex transport system substrate-binding protein
MRYRVYILLIALCVVASTAWAAYPMRVKDVRGKEILIKSKPMRIISLAPSNTEILYALGLADRIVGVTKYCDYPPAAKSKAKIGDMTVNTEAVVALKPDLILAHGMLNSAAIPRLEKLGLTVFAIDPKTLGEVARDIRTVGAITARPKTADIVASKIENAIRTVKAGAAKQPSRKVLVVIQANPLWAAGPKTFVAEMLGIANAKNVAFDARPGFVPFSRELAISRNPDVIITGLASDIDFFSKSPEWRTVSAVKNKRIYVINSDILLRAGPRLAEGLKALAGKVR